ncbi:uncharacterized protein Gasu_61500 [Galdieria sulphuraria]|uniref:RRM domain-containing protein n=1 Tax=Galdieria sulphuraria TaxID=130081 RepID=M2XRB7_GALSU|nr:uncharacterized protein Gasu_61500 [Galdieria sulphuraria]EME26208.1 hypothetical protein Gasu_61500 [Galdieria sulphuraria]|eukprot:XP_005702728.1 hypothetical protein Gasu_61500 [Galdieria sulphuraria]
MQSVEDVETLAQQEVDGSTKDAMREEQTVSNKTLYVYPTSERLNEEHLKEIFSLFGSVDKLTYVKEEKYGSIVFMEEEDAIKASTIMDGGIIDGKNIRTKVDKLHELSSFEEEEEACLPTGDFLIDLEKKARRERFLVHTVNRNSETQESRLFVVVLKEKNVMSKAEDVTLLVLVKETGKAYRRKVVVKTNFIPFISPKVKLREGRLPLKKVE